MRHNIRFCDAMLIIDRRSVDNSRRILAELIREGLPLVVFDEPTSAEIEEEELLRRACRNARRHFRPERIILLNIDEVITCANRRALERELEGVEPGSRALVSRGIVATTLRREDRNTWGRSTVDSTGTPSSIRR